MDFISSPNLRPPPLPSLAQQFGEDTKGVSYASQPTNRMSSQSTISIVPPPKETPNKKVSENRIQELWDSVTTINDFPTEAPLNVDALLDSLVALYDDCKAAEISTSQLPSFLSRYQTAVNRVKSLRPNKYDFQIIRKLAKGHFGMVSIVRNKYDGKIYAMKTLNKLYILRCKELSFYMEERDVLTLSRFSEWIPKLHATFQDTENLYLVMEYAGGGDLYNLLVRNSLPIISEDAARFYLAEVVLALSDLHSFNYVHRDLKPQNILIDNRGHIKLADFGSCIQMNADGLITSNIPVGTSDYISPEVLQAQERNGSYGAECDWWSLGILLYELLQGDPPFSSDNLLETHSQIMNHKNHLAFYGMYPISEEAKDLIQRLVCDRDVRLGKNGPEDIKSHPFFKGIDWENIRSMTPPFIPSLLTPDDTSNFSGYEGEEDNHEIKVTPKFAKGEFLGTHLPFIGFTYHSHQFQKKTETGVESSETLNKIDQPLLDSKRSVSTQERDTQTESVTQSFDTTSLIPSELSTECTYSTETAVKSPQLNKELVEHYENLIKELQSELQSSQDNNHFKDSKIAEMENNIEQLNQRLNTCEEDKVELTRILDIFEKKVDEDDAFQQDLQSANQKAIEERDKALAEVKRLKRAITEFSKVHQDMKLATITLDQSREQADTNFDIMKTKCDSLLYENQNLKGRLEKIEKLCRLNPTPEDLDRVKHELSEARLENSRLASELEAMTEANQSLISQIEHQAANNSSEPDSPRVEIDGKLYTDMIANLEIEAKNHHLLTSIYQDLQAQKELRPSLNEARESRDEALQRADQMLRLNEKQATLIKTLMDKVTYMETCLSRGDRPSADANIDSQMASLVVENQTLKRSLVFKDQKLQEIVTKLVMAEATKPSFWPKSKERAKERQRVLMHSIQSLEQKLRLVERENSQLRFINQLSQSDYSSENASDQTFAASTSGYSAATGENAHFAHLTMDSRPRSTPGTSKDTGTFHFNQTILTERSLSSKFGISHIK